MLHMIVNTHSAESCAFRGREEEEALTGAIESFKDSAPEKGLSFQGWWVNRASDEIFVLLDAASGHVIEEALLDAGLVGRSHTRILPVVTVDAAAEEGDNR